MIVYMDIYDIRRENLRGIMKARYAGKIVALAEALDRAHSYISRCLTDNEKNRKRVGEEFARDIEERLGLPPLSLDVDGDPSATSNVHVVAQPDRSYLYPVLSSVSAGLWGDAVQPFEPGAEDEHIVSDYMGKGPCFWLRVDGDSMTAQYGESFPEGSMVLVDTGIEPRPGHLVIAKLVNDDKANFKQLVRDGGRSFLKPLNPTYPLLEINGNCRLVGVVVESRRRYI